MTGAQALLKSLENHGTTEIFAYPGGAVLPIYDAMSGSSIRRILVRHEQAAAFAAQGYSRSTQGVGVCLATSGPGATNLVTGIADAMLDSIPMVAITGNVFKHLIGSDAFQETDIVGICEPIVKHSYFVESASDIPRVLAEAFHLAQTGRPGPVLIDIPKCEQIAEVNSEVEQKVQNNTPFDLELPGYKHDLEVCPNEMEEATTLIRAAKRPVVIYGHGVVLSNAETALATFLEKTNIPSCWTLHGIGAYDGQADLSLGMLGMHGTGAANFAVHNADLVLGIGIRFDDRITGKLDEFQMNKKFIHFDIDSSEFNKNITTAARLCGQIHDTLPALTQALPQNLGEQWSDWTKKMVRNKAAWPLDPAPTDRLTEITVLNQLYDTIDTDDVVVVDVGQHQMWAAQRFFPQNSRKFLTSGGLGTMGFSLPTAMGATFSGHPVWSVSGDGGFQMNSQELATIAQDNLPVKIMIFNNSFLGMVRQWQELFYDKNYVDTPLKNPDFVALGEAYGIPSFRATNAKESAELIQKMQTHDGPILVEFKLAKEENVFPMVPAGESLGDTMLGKNSKIDKA